MILNFRNIFLKISLITSLMIAFYTPVYAQVPDYTVLAELPGTTVDGKATFESYLPAAFKLAVGVAAVMAFVMITYGGIMYATADVVMKKESGKEYVTNAVYGLIFVIGAWAILYTINPKMLEFNLNLPVPKLAAVTGTVTPGVPMARGEVLESNVVKLQLQSAGIFTPNPPCAQGQTTNCTNLNQLPLSAIDSIKKFKTECGCTVIITGGTEGGHLTHGANQPVLDLGLNPGTDKYIVDHQIIGVPIIQTKLGPKYTINVNGKNTTFLKESNHWHVVL